MKANFQAKGEMPLEQFVEVVRMSDEAYAAGLKQGRKQGRTETIEEMRMNILPLISWPGDYNEVRDALASIK